MIRATRAAVAAIVLFSAVGSAVAQSSSEMLEIYKRNFARSSLSTKYQMLEDAARRDDPALAPLFDYALSFVLDNASLLGSDATLRDIAILSMDVLAKFGAKESVDTIWRVFQTFKDSAVRVSALRALGTLAVGDRKIAEFLNSYLNAQLTVYRGGSAPEYQIVEECVAALGRIGDGTSFPVLFSVCVSGMSERIAKRGMESLGMIKGDYKGYLVGIVEKGTAFDRTQALEIGLASASLTEVQKSELAAATLKAALEFKSADATEVRAIRELRFLAVRELTARKWQPASADAIRHFREMRNEFGRGTATRSNFLESIALLGAVGTTDAAMELTLFLAYINDETEKGKVYDTQVTLAVIVNLGILGPKFAFEHLLMVRNLQYPDEIKQAALDALELIRW